METKFTISQWRLTTIHVRPLVYGWPRHTMVCNLHHHIDCWLSTRIVFLEQTADGTLHQRGRLLSGQWYHEHDAGLSRAGPPAPHGVETGPQTATEACCHWHFYAGNFVS